MPLPVAIGGAAARGRARFPSFLADVADAEVMDAFARPVAEAFDS
jgi:hypothetical protein